MAPSSECRLPNSASRDGSEAISGCDSSASTARNASSTSARAVGQFLVHQPEMAPWRAARADSGTAPRPKTPSSCSSSRAVTMEAIATSI